MQEVSEPCLELFDGTTVFRREDGEWKVVHRHADPVESENAPELVERLVATDS